MRFRSFVFGGLAMLAAVMFMHAPARAIDYEPPGVSLSIEWPEIAFVEIEAIEVQATDVSAAGTDAHAAAYASQNQPLTAWRFAVDAYSHIDPHILAG